jgi:hypothetical protein
MRLAVKHGEGSIVVRKFDYDDFVATIWIGNTNAEQEADAMLTKVQVEKLIKALSAVIA